MCRIAKGVGLVLGLWSVVGMRGQNVEVSALTPDRVWVSGVVVDVSGAGIGQAEVVLQRGDAEVAEAKASAGGQVRGAIAEWDGGCSGRDVLAGSDGGGI